MIKLNVIWIYRWALVDKRKLVIHKQQPSSVVGAKLSDSLWIGNGTSWHFPYSDYAI